MQINLIRTHFSDVCSIGELTIEGDEFRCYTLEDCDRHLSQTDSTEAIEKIKVYGKTAIPYGTYEVVINFSNRFKKFMPLLIGVKGFEGIRIHAGNTEADTLGCVLTGTEKDVLNNRILNSRTAYIGLFALIGEKIKTEKVFITISKIQATV